MSGEGRYEGEVRREVVEGEKTATGAPKEHFGTGRAVQFEAGKKGCEVAKERGAGIMSDPAGYGRKGGKKGSKAKEGGTKEAEM